MKTTKWQVASDQEPYTPTPLSGPDHNLGGFDARTREIASPTGANVTSKLLRRPGKNVPKAKKSEETPSDYFTPNTGQMGKPSSPKKWTKKYL